MQTLRGNTPGHIAKRLGVPLHRITYILKKRPDIKPAMMAGTIRVYDAAAIASIRHELHAIDARRAARQEENGGASHA
jgi:hypothetical protein